MSRGTERELAALGRLTRLALDTRLGALSGARAACDATAAKLQALDAGAAPPVEGLDFAAAARAGLLYDRWIARRRSELNLVLARQTAEWRELRDAATRDFGRDAAVEALRKKLAAERKKR